MSEVELHSAYTWTCESCGRDQFMPAIETCVDLEELFEGSDSHEIDSHLAAHVEDVDEQLVEYLTQKVVLYPMYAQCKDCGAEFTTHIASELDEYDDFGEGIL